MKFLLTGASGFVGTAMHKKLLENGHEVIATSRTIVSGKNFYAKQLIPGEDWSDLLDGVTHVIHTAARAHVLKETVINPLETFRQTNTLATLSLAKQAASMGVKRFIFISTIGVNGAVTNGSAFTEKDIESPHSDYAVSKWEAEQGLWSIADESSMELVIIRPPLIYGPNVKGNFLTMLNCVKRGIPLPFRSVNNKRSFLSLENLISFIYLCCFNPAAANQLFLVCDKYDMSTPELLKLLSIAMDSNLMLFPVPTSLMKFLVTIVGRKTLSDKLLDDLQINADKATELLGWQPVVSPEQAIRAMFK